MANNPFENINIYDNITESTQYYSENIPEDVDDLSLKDQIKERYSQDTRFRKHLAHWVMWIVPLWLICVIFILISNKLLGFCLDSSVLISLLATTTFNVLGLAYIVLKGIFTHK